MPPGDSYPTHHLTEGNPMTAADLDRYVQILEEAADNWGAVLS